MDENEKIYKNIGKVYCPYFKDFIYFTQTGFVHLKFKTKFKARNRKDSEMRFKLLPIAIKVIGLSHTLQNESLRQRFEERYVNNRKEIALLPVHYYEFIAIMNGKRLRIVIKQIENKEKSFLSVIPLFKQKMPPEESDIL